MKGFEEFTNGRRAFLVFPLQTNRSFMAKCAMERFHCTRDHLRRTTGYVVGDDLYLQIPQLKGQKAVSVIYYAK